ncbi:MAG TPA: hypothetical protein VHM19_22875 [Polyangiales bacterium]|nr:hypothetical protein [Polyangiales bacterium]
MRPQGNDALERYLDEEQRQQELERQGRMGRAANAPPMGNSTLGLPANPYRDPSPSDVSESFGPTYGDAGRPRSAVPDQMPSGVTPPAYWNEQAGAKAVEPRPSSPTNAAPGAAMGLQSRPDPFGRPAPPMGAPAFAPGPPQGSPVGPMGARDPHLPDSVGAAQPTGATAGLAAASPALAVLGQYLDQKRQQQEMKRQGVRDLQADYAASLGFPTDRLRAAQINHAAGGLQGEDLLRYLLPFNGGKNLMG